MRIDMGAEGDFWKAGPGARVQSFARTMGRGLADLILPSHDDERDHFGDADPQATVARYLSCGSRQVIVKAGGAAIHFGGADGAGVVDGLERAVPVDTTSAGDSFNAGYLAARLQGAGIEASIRGAHELSRKVISHRGALVVEAV